MDGGRRRRGPLRSAQRQGIDAKDGSVFGKYRSQGAGQLRAFVPGQTLFSHRLSVQACIGSNGYNLTLTCGSPSAPTCFWNASPLSKSGIIWVFGKGAMKELHDESTLSLIVGISRFQHERSRIDSLDCVPVRHPIAYAVIKGCYTINQRLSTSVCCALLNARRRMRSPFYLIQSLLAFLCFSSNIMAVIQWSNCRVACGERT